MIFETPPWNALYRHRFGVDLAPLPSNLDRSERTLWIRRQFGEKAYLAEHDRYRSRYWFMTYEQALAFALRWRAP